MSTPYDLYFSADVETDGPIPGRFSMLAFGLVVAGRFDGETFERLDPAACRFYRELRPISDAYDPETLEVSGLDRRRLVRDGVGPDEAMTDAASWVRETAGAGTPVLVAYPLAFDWSWLYWYFEAFSRSGSPFGFSNCLDIKTAFALRAQRPIARAGRSKLPPEVQASRPHSHHALDDAMEQAEIFANVIEWKGRPWPTG
jgi:hypothetical protein